jgi:hypothetical protein
MVVVGGIVVVVGGTVVVVVVVVDVVVVVPHCPLLTSASKFALPVHDADVTWTAEVAPNIPIKATRRATVRGRRFTPHSSRR